MTQIPTHVAARTAPPEPITGSLKIAQKTGLQTGTASNIAYDFVIKDYSKSGLGIYINHVFPANTFIEISIQGITHPPLECKTVWSKPAQGEGPKGFSSSLGLTFTPRDDEARDNQLSMCRELDRMVAKMVQRQSGKLF